MFFRKVVPEAMYDLPLWISRTYPEMPLLISEFGEAISLSVFVEDAGQV